MKRKERYISVKVKEKKEAASKLAEGINKLRKSTKKLKDALTSMEQKRF